MTNPKSAIVEFKCKGYDVKGQPALQAPVDVTARVSRWPENSSYVSSNVKCPYNTGGEGQRCKASHPHVDKLYDGDTPIEIYCPFSFDVNVGDSRRLAEKLRLLGLENMASTFSS